MSDNSTGRKPPPDRAAGRPSGGRLDSFLHDLSWVLPLRSEAATAIANGFTWLGYAPFFIIALPVVYWLWDKRIGVHLALVVVLTAVSNGLLKDIFDDPRPPVGFAVDPRVGDSYGLPSGHAQIAVAMWFWIAFELRRGWAWGAAAFIALGVCLSRLYLGVHDVEDVLAGAILGVATLLVFAWAISPHFAWWRALPAAVQIGVLLAVQVPLYLLWPEPGGPGGVFAVGGMLVGWWGGALLERQAIRFQRHPNWLVAVGTTVAVVAICFFALTRIGAGLAVLGVPALAGAWAQYLVIGLFVTALGPWIAQRLGLAGRAGP